MVRVVINGVGRLGRAILQASVDQASVDREAVVVVAGVDRHSEPDLPIPLYPELQQVTEGFDVLIDSSSADGLSEVLAYVTAESKPLVIAATGHSDAQKEQIAETAAVVPVFQASNLSVGVNVVRRLTEQAGRMLGSVDAEIVETHHRMKVDAPSGTALTLAESLRDATDPEREIICGRSSGIGSERGNEIAIHALRGGTVVGEHTVRFLMEDEVVEIRHVAQSRLVFGFGALSAAQFIARQPPGLYGMTDLLDAQ